MPRGQSSDRKAFSRDFPSRGLLHIVIWPEARKAQNNMAAVYAQGRTVCVRERRGVSAPSSTRDAKIGGQATFRRRCQENVRGEARRAREMDERQMSLWSFENLPPRAMTLHMGRGSAPPTGANFGSYREAAAVLSLDRARMFTRTLAGFAAPLTIWPVAGLRTRVPAFRAGTLRETPSKAPAR